MVLVTAPPASRTRCGVARHVCASKRPAVSATAQSTSQAQCSTAHDGAEATTSRRQALLTGGLTLLSACAVAGAGPAAAAAASAAADDPALLKKYTPMDALRGKDYGKPRLRYPDFVTTDSGLQYKDLRLGSGAEAHEGDLVTMDWDGYTIGYYGRPFEARNKPKGGSFSGENKEYYRFVLGSHAVIPALEEAVAGMRAGGIRRVIVPEELGYPEGGWSVQGPAPSTFAGQRALGFVLGNKGMIDKTLLIDVELIRLEGSSK